MPWGEIAIKLEPIIKGIVTQFKFKFQFQQLMVSWSISKYDFNKNWNLLFKYSKTCLTMCPCLLIKGESTLH
jgi:hypothetical protein